MSGIWCSKLNNDLLNIGGRTSHVSLLQINTQLYSYVFVSFQSGSNAYGYAYGRSRSGSHQNYYRSRSEADNDTRLKNLVRDIRTSLNNTRNFWIKLPYDVCRDNNEKNGGKRNQWSSSSSSRGTRYSQNGNCWNGNDAGRYTKALVSDGLLMQERNPEVHVDVNRPDIFINEQILALKLITRKLESAHKGQNVEWPASTENCKFFFPAFLFSLTMNF